MNPLLILRLVPLWAWPMLAFVVFAGVQTERVSSLKAQIASMSEEWANERAQAQAVAADRERQARDEERRRTEALQKVIDEKERQAAQARADAVIAGAAAGRLQKRVAALVAAAHASPGDSQTAASGETTDDPAALLAELQRRADARAGELARIADERGAAGTACERAYDALTDGRGQ